MLERWRPVPGWEGYYEVSDHGRVRSVDRLVPVKGNAPYCQKRLRSKLLKAAEAKTRGHMVVNLCRDKKCATHYVHRLVLLAFVGPCPDGRQCRHLNGDPTDNNLLNLAWGTPHENAMDRRDHVPPGPSIPTLSVAQVARVKAELQSDQPRKLVEIAREYGVQPHVIRWIKAGKNYASVAPDLPCSHAEDR